MEVLIIGLGHLGRYLLKELCAFKSAKIYVYTTNKNTLSKIATQKNVTPIYDLRNAPQPDIIFITANNYTPKDRITYFKTHYHALSPDFRDDEASKNKAAILDIANQIKHLEAVPIILTANPPELLVTLLNKKLKWKHVYNMQMMVDNLRISKLLNVPEENYLCLGEHGQPVPTISHVVANVRDAHYKKISMFMAMIWKIAYKHKGVPQLQDSKKELSRIVNALMYNKKLKCILTTPGKPVSMGKPFVIQGLKITEQPLPKMSARERLIFAECAERLARKWH